LHAVEQGASALVGEEVVHREGVQATTQRERLVAGELLDGWGRDDGRQIA
jgi:hypothetical protein